MTEFIIYLAIKNILAEYLQGWATKLNFVDSSLEKSIGIFVKLQNAKYRVLADASETNKIAHIQLFMIGEASEHGLFEAGSLAETIRNKLITNFNSAFTHEVTADEQTDTYELSWLRCDPMSGSEFIGYNQNQAPQYSINVRLTFNVERRNAV